MFVASAATALGCALIPVVALRLGLNWRAAVLAGSMAALLPLKFRTETMGDWESPYAAIALMALVVLTAWLWSERAWTTKWAVVAGLIWGAALLVSYSYIFLFWVILGIGIWVAGRGNYRPYLRFGMIQTAVVFLCLAPWAIRNYIQLGSPIFGRSNTGLELRISNNDEATANEQTNFHNGIYSIYHPLQSVPQARLVQQLGEVKFNELAMDQAREWIEAHPRRFLWLTLGRFGLFWFPTDGGMMKVFILCSITVLGWAGLVIVWNQHRVSALVLVTTLLIVPLPNYLVHVALKHSYPVEWIITMLAAVTLVAVYDRLFRSTATQFAAQDRGYLRKASDPSGIVTS